MKQGWNDWEKNERGTNDPDKGPCLRTVEIRLNNQVFTKP